MAEREAVVLAAAQDHIRLQAKGGFLSTVFPDETKRREMAARLEKITRPPIDGNPSVLRVFDLPPVHEEVLIVDEAHAVRSRELAGLHDLQRTSTDPTERRKGLGALKWMKSAKPADLRPVLLAYLKNHRMDWFAEDLLSAWVLQDWRSCEVFATNAPFSVQKRDDMLIHIFCEAAEIHPDDTLARLRDLLRSKVLVPAALNGGSSGSRVKWLTHYDGGMIVSSLARGLLRQGDMKALATIQSWPAGWQINACEVLAREFTTTECGNALLASLEQLQEDQNRQPARVRWDYDIEITQVLGRLASISPANAVEWLEARPEQLRDPDDRRSSAHRVHAVWSETDPKAADAWMEKVKREQLALNRDVPAPNHGPGSGPLLPAVPQQ
jgi:hypothetical protein